MFNVTRTEQVPQSIKDGKTDYNQADILNALDKMFYSKCYICEIKSPEALAIEHFNATNPNRTEWNNLFFACHRCNSNLKGRKYNNLLDPTCPNTDVFKSIHHRAPMTPNSNISITKPDNVDESDDLNETIELIDRVFNDDSTGNRRLSRKSLRKRVFTTISKVYKEIIIWSDEDTPQSEKLRAEEKIIHFLRVEQEFSAFIRWLILDDETLRDSFSHHIKD